MAALAFFVLGCAVGSFLNVCIWRLPRGISINSPRRSFCPKCRAGIDWYDNIPVLSYVVLGGRCRHCGVAISARYPLIECITGLCFAALYVLQHNAVGQDVGQIVLMALTFSLLIVASAIDAEFLIIPDEISIFGIAGGLLAGLLLPGIHVGAASHNTFSSLTGLRNLDGLIGSGVGAAVGAGVVLVFAILGGLIFRKEAMGFGDVKLMAMVGALMGWKVAVLAFFVAPFFGLIYGLPLLILKRGHIMPYGPFLSAGAALVIMFRSFFCERLQDYVYIAGELFSAFLGL